MRYMYDGVNPSAVHASFPSPSLVAGYVNGRYAWNTANWNLFPHATKVTISISANTPAMVLDCEIGDASPGQCEGWITLAKEHGIYRPTIYCNLSTVPAVRTGTGKYVLGTDYDLWVADYDDSTSSVYAGIAAKQYATAANYDASVVYDDAWPHVTAPTAGHSPIRGLSQTAYPAFTDFSWGADNLCKAYDFQLMHGSTQVHRQAVTGTHLGNIATDPGTAYTWRVAGENGTAPWSAYSSFTTPKSTTPPVAPPADYQYAAPIGLTARGGRTSFAATWSAPAHGTYLAPAYTLYVYDVTHAVAANANEVASYPRTVTTTSMSGGSLTAGHTYEIHVVSHNPSSGANTKPFAYASARFTCG